MNVVGALISIDHFEVHEMTRDREWFATGTAGAGVETTPRNI